MIPIPVGDVDRSRLPRLRVGLRIDIHVGRVVQQGPAAVVAGRPARRIGRVGRQRLRSVAPPLLADLQQHLRAVVTPFLYDAVPVAGNPDVVLVVDETAVEPIGQGPRATVGQQRGIAPRVHHVAVGVVLDDRRRRHRQRPQRRLGRFIGAIEGDEMAPRVEAARADAPGDPLPLDASLVRGCGKWLWPHRVDGVSGRGRVALRLGQRLNRRQSKRQGQPRRSQQQRAPAAMSSTQRCRGVVHRDAPPLSESRQARKCPDCIPGRRSGRCESRVPI